MYIYIYHIYIHPGKLTWQCKTNHLKMYLWFSIVILVFGVGICKGRISWFHDMVSSLYGGNRSQTLGTRFIEYRRMVNEIGPPSTFPTITPCRSSRRKATQVMVTPQPTPWLSQKQKWWRLPSLLWRNSTPISFQKVNFQQQLASLLRSHKGSWETGRRKK